MIIWVSLIVAFWVGYVWAVIDDQQDAMFFPVAATLLTFFYLAFVGLSI